uniref:HTH CENPB-type domain-containing protein n=1 Tax=Bionectria ochroleuca TaxID=29856 RepID=A0A8H7K2R3_BIOOC
MDAALDYHEKNPGISLRRVAKLFGVPRATLQDHVKTPRKRKEDKNCGRLLTAVEEKALCNYIDRLDSINMAVRGEFVCDAANAIIRARHRPDDTTPIHIVKPRWATRFFQRHGYSSRPQNMLDLVRKEAENIDVIRDYFRQLQEVIDREGILPDDTWNMDETGFRIGMKSNAMIIMKRKRAYYFALPENRESATAVKAISASGRVIPACLILSSLTHCASWYHELQGLDPEARVAVAETGYSNDELALSWLQHFNEYSRKGQVGAKRLLLIDGHGSHHAAQFIEFCDNNGIIPFGMPSNLTHLLQPLDVCVFQPYKHYHGLALDRLVRDGAVEITKLDFLSIIEEVRKKAFKLSTIKAAFKKSGIYPLDCSIIIKEILNRQPLNTPSPPYEPSFSEITTPTTYRQLNKSANKIEKVIFSDPSFSPSKAQLLGRFVRGALFSAATGVQMQRDLSRTKYATAVRSQKRNAKNYRLQSGGVLKGSEARNMIIKRKGDDIAKAQAVLDGYAKKLHNTVKKGYFETAKKAREWRRIGILDPLEILVTGRTKRFLIKG